MSKEEIEAEAAKLFPYIPGHESDMFRMDALRTVWIDAILSETARKHWEEEIKKDLCKILGHAMFSVYNLNNFENGGRSSWGRHKCSRCGHTEDWQYDHI